MTYKVLDVAHYVIHYSNQKNYGVSNLKLQPLLYFIQAYFLIQKSEPCFDDPIQAWEIGPVVPRVYQEYKQYPSSNIPEVKFYITLNKNNPWDVQKVKFDDTIISDRDKASINLIIDHYKDYAGSDLSHLACLQKPWLDAYSSLQSNIISNSVIRDFFLQVDTNQERNE